MFAFRRFQRVLRIGRPTAWPVARIGRATAWRPGLRTLVAVPSVALVIAMALVISDGVAKELRDTATASALHNVEAIVRGYVDPALHERSLDLGADQDPSIDAQLERLTASGDIRRINLWSRDGTIFYSNVEALRGRRLSIGPGVAAAFAGESVGLYAGDPSADAGIGPALPARYLALFVPVRGAIDANPIGVYEVYQDARTIEARVEATRQEAFRLALLVSSVLLGLVWLAFAGAARALGRQNRLLREQAETERLLLADLQRSEERFRSLVRNASDTVAVLDADGTIRYESPAVERVLGYRAEDRIGRSVLESLHPDDLEFVGQRLAEVAQTDDGEAIVEVRARHADGSWRAIEAFAKNLLGDPAVGGIVVNYRDVTERKDLEEQLRHQAFHDSLTGLANRALFLDRLEHALASRRRRQRPLAVLFLDLDEFKGVNDRLGHGEGDRLLSAVAARLRSSTRAADTIARMGGDEFAVLLEDAPRAGGAERVARRVLELLREPYVLAGREFRVMASIGVALQSASDETADQLLRHADVAMYAAKSQGGDRITIFQPHLYETTVARMELKGDLHGALERREFTLFYQPLVDLVSGSVVGAEALLRWDHPSRGLVPPAEFVPLAEETGEIVPIGRWVLHEACGQAAVWRELPGHSSMSVSVNLSVRQIVDSNLVADVHHAVEAAGLDAVALTLEITESVFLEDSEAILSTLKKLKALGVRLAIDDFGTGYSSLGYLRRFPVDILKIDRSFVASLNHGTDQVSLVRSILRLGRSMHLEMVAEGVEQPEQAQVLKSLGARLVQGFLLAAPMEAEAFDALLRRPSAEPASLDRSARPREDELVRSAP